MKNIRNLLIGSAICVAMAGNAQQINPMTRAVLNGYQEVLDENPKDYQTLYERAGQYYRLDMYNEALVDIIKAIDYTPAKETIMKSNEYSLLADIYIQTKEYEKALSAVQSALDITPGDYALVYKKGNICLYLKKGEEAYRTFSSMQTLRTRSQEAYFGMARADIMMGKKAEAEELLKQAEQADPSNYITYCRIGDLYVDMGEDENAAANYLSAFSLSTSDPRPLESLISLGNRDYSAVATALQYAISKTNNKTPMYFLAGNIALNTGNYQEAYSAFQELLTDQDSRIAGVYANMARTCLALNKIEEAETNADLAIMREPTVENLLIKADCEIASGNGASALLSAQKAVSADPNSTEAKTKEGVAYMIMGEGKKALQCYNEAIMSDPTAVETLMLRAYTEYKLTDDAKQSIVDYTRVAQQDAVGFPAIAYKAMAQCYAGKKIDADETMKRALEKDKKELTKDDYYWGAVYYSQTGDLEKGYNMLSEALKHGYQNLYNLKSNKVADLNIAPIRHLLK